MSWSPPGRTGTDACLGSSVWGRPLARPLLGAGRGSVRTDGEAEGLPEQKEYERGAGLVVPLPSRRRGRTVALTTSPACLQADNSQKRYKPAGGPSGESPGLCSMPFGWQ